MLHFIRENAKGWIAWIIIGLLIIPFALWGINEYFGGGGSVSIATVNGTEISQRDFQQAFLEQRNRMRQALGEQYDASLFDTQIRESVINQLVERELVRQYAEDSGFRISETLVANTIRKLEAFQESGAFSTSLYEQQVRSSGQSPTAFEHRLQLAMLVSQVSESLLDTAFVTDAEVDDVIKLREQKRSFDYLVLPMVKYRDESLADDAAIQSYYDNNAQRFMSDEQMRVEYVELAASDLIPQEVPDENVLREFFDGRANEYRVPEERQVKHILIQVDENADEAVLNTARTKAEELLVKINAGESFEDLARSHSDDPGSAPAGGELGIFSRGVMDPVFEEAAFGLNKGQVSELVRTSFGFHILKLEAIHESRGKNFEDVRQALLAEYQGDIAEKRYFELAEQLTNLAYTASDSLSDVAIEVGLELKQSPFFTRAGGEDLFSKPAVIKAAFSEDVLRQGYNSEPLEVAQNHVLVIRLLEHREARQEPLEAVKEQVKGWLLTQAAQESVADAGNAVLEQLKLVGEAYESVARPLGVEWKQGVGLGRSAREVSPPLVAEAFRLNKPETDVATYGSVVLANGDFALIRLTAVTEGDSASYDKVARETLKRRLAGEYGRNAERRLLESLKANAKVVLNTDDI